MLAFQELLEMCQPPEGETVYYRPFICNGSLSKADIFFVGINPATPITSIDMGVNAYVNLLLNYKMFINYYKSVRLKNGKNGFSRTRIGMNSFFDVLRTIYNGGIVETNIICYPTSNLKELRKEPKNVINKGKEIFYKLLMELKPKLIILQGKETVGQTLELLINNGLVTEGLINLEDRIEDMEKRSSLLEFTYSNGKKGVIIACRHFMYYGKQGDPFADFRENTMKIVSSY